MWTPHLRFGFCFILNVCLQLWESWHELLLFSYVLALMQLWDISQSKGKSMQRKLSGSHIVLQCYHNFDCWSLFSIIAASVEVSYAVTVQPKNTYCRPSPQNHCECVTTAIMFYPVARFKQIKSLRDTTVCWFYVNSSNIMIWEQVLPCFWETQFIDWLSDCCNNEVFCSFHLHIVPCCFPHQLWAHFSANKTHIQVTSASVFELCIVTEHCSSSRNWPLASKSIELWLEINYMYCAFYIKISFVKWHNSVYWCDSWIIGLTLYDCVSSHLGALHCFIFPAVPTPPQKTDKVEDDTSSGEDNSDDDEGATETSAVSEYQVPTTVCN